jgi:hemolysin D
MCSHQTISERRLQGNLILSDKKPNLSVVQQFQSETDSARESMEPSWARITILVLVGLVMSLVTLMALTTMDRVVTSNGNGNGAGGGSNSAASSANNPASTSGGKIVTTQLLNVLQALDPSIIRSIDVLEGQQVAKGQKLATLDPTFAAADVKQLRLQIIALKAQIARDEAELDSRPLTYPVSDDPDVKKYAAMNKAYYDQQVAQYKSQIDSYDAKIKQTQATILKYQTDERGYLSRSDIARQIEDMRTILSEHGAGSELNKLIAQDQRVDMVRNLDYDHNSLSEAQHMLASTQADKEAFIQQWNTNLSQDLVTARSSLDTSEAQFEKAVKHQDLVVWTAEEPSIVLTVAKLSVGSVLTQGAQLFTLMPMDTELQAEGDISSRDVGFVRIGDHCTLKIDAFYFVEHGTAEGHVLWISEGAFLQDDNGNTVPAYYKVRCSIEAKHFVNIGPNSRVMPGMSLETDLLVGTRSVLMYVLGGVFRGLSESMREP